MSKVAMYQSIEWIKDALSYVEWVLKDQYEHSLNPEIKDERNFSRIDQEPNVTVVEIREPFLIMLSQNKSEIERMDRFTTSFRKKLLHAYAKHCFNV